MAGTVFDLSTLGTSSNKIVFNDYDYQFQTGLLFRMEHRSPTRREVREFDIPTPEVNGVADFQTLIGKEYLVLSGTMYADDDSYYASGRDLLRTVTSLEINNADQSTDSGYVPYYWTEASGDRQMFVKPLYVDVPEATRQGLVQPFRILCKVKRPKIYSLTKVSGIVGATSTPTISGGTSGLSFGFPVFLGASTYTTGGPAINRGTLSSFPSFTIIGPAINPRITNNNTGEYIEVDVNLATTADTLNISYNEDSIDINRNGVSVYNALTAGSTLFKVKPGITTFTYQGGTNTTSTATYAFYSVWPA